MTGIVNGTTNYVLTRMTEERCSFAAAVAEAQELGYAERDPTADIDGFDAAAKAAIIASIAFGARVVAGDVSREGITRHHGRRHRRRRRARLRREAARGRRGVRRRGERARAPGDGAGRSSARVGARLVQRGVHRRRGGRPADAARPRRRRRSDRERACSAISSTRPRTCTPARAAPRSARSSAARSARSTRRRRSSTCRSTPPTSPVCSPRSPACSASTTCRSSRCSKKGQGDDARLIFVTHLALESALARRRSATCASSTAVKRVGSVLRVVGGEE